MIVRWRADHVVTPDCPDADTLVSRGGRIAWVGRHEDAPPTAQQVDLRGSVLASAFVDGHVHTTATGLALDGLDLHDATSLNDALDRLAAHVRIRPGEIIRGTGWDESTWPERRPPTAAELDRATGGAIVYLARADVHSAVASSALLARCDLAGADGVIGDGLVRLDAHHVVRHVVNTALSPGETRRAQRRALAEAARLGIGSVHEMGGPEIAGIADLEALLTLVAEEPTVSVAAYWGALGDVTTSQRLGLVGAGGDLFCDGSIGSHTAALRSAYADDDTAGSVRFDLDELSDHIVAAARVGLQSGFHVIGDAAVDVVLTAYERAAEVIGLDALRAGRHRLEHVEMADDDAVRRIAALGLTASVQPAFDTAWGGTELLYAERLGVARGTRLNPFARFHDADVRLALGSDSPVTPLDPWGAVRGAVQHRTGELRVDVRTAYDAATAGGHRAVGRDDSGVLRPGYAATFAAWAADDVPVDWWRATHKPGCFDVSAAAPRCRRTVVDGATVHDAETP